MDNIDKFAELFKILCENFNGAELGKKATQKMFYFFERKGINLNLRYGIHYYGPYSSKLDNIIQILESEDYITIDTSRTTHLISLGDERISNETLSVEDKEKVDFVINNFAHKTPMELEALTTMDYISNCIFEEHKSDNDLITMFKEIKGTKFNDTLISITLIELKSLGFITAA